MILVFLMGQNLNFQKNPVNETIKPIPDRKIRYASARQAKVAGDWAIKKYASVFKKLAQ